MLCSLPVSTQSDPTPRPQIAPHPAFAATARRLWGGPKLDSAIRDLRMRELAQTIAQEPDNWPRIQREFQKLGLSSAYLSVRFKENAGLPMRSYALWMKFEHACGLVLSGARPFDAALQAGFADQSHLGRAARRFAKKSFWRAVGELERALSKSGTSRPHPALQNSPSAGPSSTNPS